MKKILVPVDFTTTSDNAIDYAIQLVAKTGGEIRLLHAVDDPFFTENPDMDFNSDSARGVEFPSDPLYKIMTEAKLEMENLVNNTKAKITSASQEVTLSQAIYNGFAEDIILQEAGRFHPQLIVMGSHGHKRLDRVFFGSVTQGIIRNAHFPVLAIPVDYAFREIQDVVYMTDLMDEDIFSIGKLLNLFSPFSIKLHVTHFSNSDDPSTEEEQLFKLNEQVMRDHKEVKIEYEMVDARILRDAYQQYIDNKNIGLIALTTRKRSHFKRFFNAGTAVDALYHSHLPLLVFHQE